MNDGTWKSSQPPFMRESRAHWSGAKSASAGACGAVSGLLAAGPVVVAALPNSNAAIFVGCFFSLLIAWLRRASSLACIAAKSGTFFALTGRGMALLKAFWFVASAVS